MLFFNDSKKKQVLQRQILGIINRTDADLPRMDEQRADRRFLRAVPVVLAPWVDSHPVSDDHAFAVTRDISLGGMGLILQQPFRADEVVIGVRRTGHDHGPASRSAQYFIGSITGNTPIGGGFWLLSVELSDTAVPDESREFRKLQEYALRLTPPVVATGARAAVPG